MDTPPLRAELERLAGLLEEAATSVRRISQALQVIEPPELPAEDAVTAVELQAGSVTVTDTSPGAPSEPTAAHETSTSPVTAPVPPSSDDLERLIPTAAVLLRREPDRIWRDTELVRGVVEAADTVQVDFSRALIDGLIRRLIRRGFLTKPAPERYRAVVGETEEEEEPVGFEGEITRLEREIDASMPHLGMLASSNLKAQVAIWGARARIVQDTAADLNPEWEKRLFRVFGRLGTIVKQHRCGWVDVLNRQWSTDWTTYLAVQRGLLTDLPLALTREQEEEYQAAELRGLLAPGRVVEPAEADGILLDALDVLGEDDPLVTEALERFGDPRQEAHPAAGLRRRRRSPSREEPEEGPEVPDAVLAMTREQRALIAGGQGSQEEQRQAIEKVLQFASLEWETVERGQVAPLLRVAERIRGGSYDLVFFLSAFTSHKGTVVVDACRKAGVPLVYLNRGYNPSRVVHEIEEQLTPGSDS